MSKEKKNVNTDEEKAVDIISEEDRNPDEPSADSTRTPGVTIIMYLAGFLFLALALFMLGAAVIYIRKYLDSYDASFAAMWSYSVQYLIGQFAPYLGAGLILLGLGRAIKVFSRRGAVSEPVFREEKTENLSNKELSGGLAKQLDDMTKEIEALREVMGIKIEETEKRQTYRLDDSRKILEGRMATEKFDREADNKLLLEKVDRIAKQASFAGGTVRPFRRGRRFIK